MNDLNDAWEHFCENDALQINVNKENTDKDVFTKFKSEVPKSSDIYISTKTKISYLNQPINLKTVFWEIPIMPYHLNQIGFLKKQMKFNSLCKSELDFLTNKVKDYSFYDEHVISHIDNPQGRIKFKDVRKISIGMSKKDITSYRCKKKSAFYNCFVIIVRIKIKSEFKEVHVKVFNTGKLEIPGIQTDEMLYKTLEVLTDILKNLPSFKQSSSIPLEYLSEKNETVLINSNFNCGYYINRDKLYTILREKYKINVVYDACSYPGLQCEFYHDQTKSIQTGQQISGTSQKISFMIFRTGSILIVGKCTDEILNDIYEFLKQLLAKEYEYIKTENENDNENRNNINSSCRKIKKKTITLYK